MVLAKYKVPTTIFDFNDYPVRVIDHDGEPSCIYWPSPHYLKTSSER
jgi:hypothetical protein